MNYVGVPLLACALLTSGCSALTMEAAPANHARLVAFHCTSNNVAPGLDLLWTVSAGATAGVAGSEDASNSTLVAATAGVVAASLLASSIYGFMSTSHCRDALRASERRANEAAGVVPGGVAGGVRRLRPEDSPTVTARLTTVPGRTPEDETLQATIGNSFFRVLLHGHPRGDGIIKLTAARQSTTSTHARCEQQIDMVVEGKREQLPGTPVHESVPAGAQGFEWEMLTVELGRDRADALASTTTTRIAACGTELTFTRAQGDLMRRFLSTWDEMAAARSAEPASAPEVAAPADAAPPASGCDSDTDCEGDLICKAGQCAAPASPP